MHFSGINQCVGAKYAFMSGKIPSSKVLTDNKGDLAATPIQCACCHGFKDYLRIVKCHRQAA